MPKKRSKISKRSPRQTKRRAVKRRPDARSPRTTLARDTVVARECGVLVISNAALGMEIRAYPDEAGEPWFILQEVVRAMGLVSAASAARDLPPHTKTRRGVQTAGGPQPMTLINEGGLYRLAGKSRKPAARRFTSWAFDDVFPTIRRTGSYTLPHSDGASGPTAAQLLEEIRALRVPTNTIDREAEDRFILNVVNQICRQEGIKPRQLALEMGYPPGRQKPFASVPTSEIEKLKAELRKRLIDDMTITERVIPRPKDTTQRRTNERLDYSPDEVVDKLRGEKNLELHLTVEELAGPMGIYHFCGLYPHSNIEEGDVTPYLDTERYLFLVQWVKANMTTVELIRALAKEVSVKVRTRIAVEHVQDQRDFEVVFTEGVDADDDLNDAAE